jgi:hypothetical protein
MIGSILEKEEIVLFSSMMTIDRQAMAMIYARFIRINKKIPLLRVLTKVSLRTTPERDLFPITDPSSFRKPSAWDVFQPRFTERLPVSTSTPTFRLREKQV